MGTKRFTNIRLDREYRTLGTMIGLYCRKCRQDQIGLCTNCAELYNYAAKQLEACPYGKSKPACSKCPIHCYQPEMRDRIREVMRFSGPRIIWYHPILAIRYLIRF